MSVSGIGSTTTLTVQALVDMRARLDDLQRQLGTGKKAETYAGVGLDRGLAVGLRAQLSAIGGFGDTMTNVGVRLDLAQTALGRIADIGRSVKSATQLTPYQLDGGGQTTGQKTAYSELDEMLGLLNTQAGDRYLFSGLAVRLQARKRQFDAYRRDRDRPGRISSRDLRQSGEQSQCRRDDQVIVHASRRIERGRDPHGDDV